ncbi:MAG: PEP-CTERM sorting domain-containing protein [Candidatus Omnitrophota bacterium]
MRNKKLGLILGAALIGLTLATARADAALLNIDILLPDILSNSTGVYNYDAATDLFSSTATPLTITFTGLPGSHLSIIGPKSYSVGFYVNSSGNFVSGIAGDDLVISGNIDVDGDSVIDYSGDLIRGEVTRFGWLDTGTQFDLFNYTFDFTGGALSSYYAPYSYKGGDSMSSEHSSFTGSFATNFSGTKVKHDTAPIPEPSSLLLLGSGLLSAALLRVRRKK